MVSKLFIYPVKSCKGIQVESFVTGKHAAELGALVDRQFMVVDHKRRLLTARKHPNMVLIDVSVVDNTLTMRYPGLEEVRINIPDSAGVKLDSGYDVFGDQCQGADLGEAAGRWLSEVILNNEAGGLRLVFHPKSSSSRPDKAATSVAPNMNVEDKPYFADTFAYMMLSAASIAGLNKMLDKEEVDLRVEETRFRPNILIEGDFPEFAEDKWPSIKIGEVVFRNVRVCDRWVGTAMTRYNVTLP